MHIYTKLNIKFNINNTQHIKYCIKHYHKWLSYRIESVYCRHQLCGKLQYLHAYCMVLRDGQESNKNEEDTIFAICLTLSLQATCLCYLCYLCYLSTLHAICVHVDCSVLSSVLLCLFVLRVRFLIIIIITIIIGMPVWAAALRPK